MGYSYSIDLSYTHFPPYYETDSQGIIAYGGKIDPVLLLDAYIHGIFPWYNGDIPLWWNPDPRFILFPGSLRVAKSMRPYFNKNKLTVTYNQEFKTVIETCCDIKRKGQEGTWLNPEMIEAYTLLHQDGYAHSVEVWKANELVGGIYGILLGEVFFGESMFSKISNASKFGFISLVQKLKEMGIKIIDCQQETKHLASLGAENISREEFMKYILQNHNNQEFRQII
jgi:leucyl/phenylalanyl-tRNA--protein transferase